MEDEHKHQFQFERYISSQERLEGRIFEEISELVRCSCGEEQKIHVLYKNEFNGPGL